jgi:CRISPR-associated endonuclease/helicase Cas3
MTDSSLGYFGYWGKAKREDGQPSPDYHLLAYHSLDVAAVGWHLLNPKTKLCQELASFIELTPQQLQGLFTFALAVHDLGKFSGAFQALKNFNSPALHQFAVRKPYDGKNARHDMMGWVLWKIALEEGLDLSRLTQQTMTPAILEKVISLLLGITWGHHGKPIKFGRLVELEDHLVDENILHATSFIEDVSTLLKPDWAVALFDPEVQIRFRQVSWHLAGLGILADWLGSDTDYFPYKNEHLNLSTYWTEALSKAESVLAATDIFKTFEVNPFGDFQQHFGFTATPLQQWSATVPLGEGPQLFILEDVTGSGKTEAALTLTQRIMAAGEADGFYFGLPSMATSNAMFNRIISHYQSMYKNGAPSIVLAHSARNLEQSFKELLLPNSPKDKDYQPDEQTASAVCNEWFADSRKKALLAPVGVGTVDQALLAVLPRRHQALRMIGLHRKVLIFDEVHAADEYMLVLMQDLLQLHARQGGSVILLTATLAKRQRKQLITCWSQALGKAVIGGESNAFPLATQVNHTGMQQTALASRTDVCRTLNVAFLHSTTSCVTTIVDAVAKGLSVVWICNSVGDALTAYEAVNEALADSDRCVLFHSRFALVDRQQIEKRVLRVLGKQSTQVERMGQVIISTQVFQESLDADTDVMISDICPIDDLIQRAGRLHRHTRDKAGTYRAGIEDQRSAPVLYVHCPEFTHSPEADWLAADFRNTQLVYRSPGKLWLGLRVLIQQRAIRMPEDARLLIEAVYGEHSSSEIPETLMREELVHHGEIQLKTNKAMQQTIDWRKGYCADSAVQWYEDDSDISTRYSDIETVEVIVLKRDESGKIKLWADGQASAMALSKLKLPKHHADKLCDFSAMQPNEAEQFKEQYSQTKYSRFWLAEDDPNFSYSQSTGFSINKDDNNKEDE